MREAWYSHQEVKKSITRNTLTCNSVRRLHGYILAAPRLQNDYLRVLCQCNTLSSAEPSGLQTRLARGASNSKQRQALLEAKQRDAELNAARGGGV